MEVIKNPIRSNLVKLSFKKSHAIKADVAGIKKNIETVLLAELFFIKYINIVKAPNDTINIWWLIANINVFEKSIYGSINKTIINKWNKQPPSAWFILLIDKGRLLLNFFCHNVENVIANNAITVATSPAVGILEPTSKPSTRPAPTNPNKTPSHCLRDTFSFNIVPLNAFVRTGCRVTINAAMLVGIPIEIE